MDIEQLAKIRDELETILAREPYGRIVHISSNPEVNKVTEVISALRFFGKVDKRDRMMGDGTHVLDEIPKLRVDSIILYLSMYKNELDSVNQGYTRYITSDEKPSDDEVKRFLGFPLFDTCIKRHDKDTVKIWLDSLREQYVKHGTYIPIPQIIHLLTLEDAKAYIGVLLEQFINKVVRQKAREQDNFVDQL